MSSGAGKEGIILMKSRLPECAPRLPTFGVKVASRTTSNLGNLGDLDCHSGKTKAASSILQKSGGVGGLAFNVAVPLRTVVAFFVAGEYITPTK